ncbi:DUF4189 domain-containing protein [Sphingopyxis sp. JAI128]|uniref:DUF4189 domain-containing protein n=1 Tax=Sphingopyxis sp. JAI128 TaxID=2723066 RepID=UPI00162160D2|nr:DUF4189 domain-containing protein [Sphingopyxis sp. JAI128]MBB6427871.1 hypothetical protein [Sphingopyxis sp. JAI128]
MKKIALTVAFLTGLIGTSPASAQSCPAGTTYNPGGPGGAQPCIPISDYSGGSSPAPSSSGSNSYAAMARHPDAADIWADGNYSGAYNDAEANSIEMCNRVMGGGCATGGKWWDSSMKILRNSHGDFYNMWMGGDAGQRKQAMAECSAKQLLPCEVFATIRSSTDIRNPGAEARKYYAVSAWVIGDKSSGYNNKLYVASGHRSYEAASAAAIKACSDATSRKCEINTWTGNGVIQAFRMDSSEYGIAETSTQRAKQAAQLDCKQQKSKKCDLQAVFDSRKPGLFVHDFAAAKAE